MVIYITKDFGRNTRDMLRRISLALTLILLLLATCPASASEVFVVSVDLNVNAMALLEGGSGRQLTATVSPAEAAGARVLWMSSNESVATVDSKGFVTPRGRGTTIITAETANAELTEAIGTDKHACNEVCRNGGQL